MSRPPASAVRADIYTRITEEIASAIDAGAGDWRMPWHHDGAATARPKNVASTKPYRGINILALWIAAQSRRYALGLWGTYPQWSKAGCQVRRGERGTTVVLWKEIQSADGHDTTDDDPGGRRRFFARAYTVFNVAQVDGYQPAPSATKSDDPTFGRVDPFVHALDIPIVTGAYNAHYNVDRDTVFMPHSTAFDNPAAYASVICHELAHATGAKHRLDRNFQERFNDDARAMEEMVADLTAAYILADLGIAHRPRPDHASYLASWLTVLKHDPKAIFTAASRAQQAADWMHAQQPKASPCPTGSHGIAS